MKTALRQFRYLSADVGRMQGHRGWRLIGLLFSQSFQAVALYRLDRFLFLALGNAWRVIRTLLAPLFFLFRPWIRGCEIHYAADIGPGMVILHPSLGVAVSPYVVIGENCTLAGGNCIGIRDGLRSSGWIHMGNYVMMSANSVVLAPARIGSRVTINPAAVVMRDVPSDVIVGNAPARRLPPAAGSIPRAAPARTIRSTRPRSSAAKEPASIERMIGK